MANEKSDKPEKTEAKAAGAASSDAPTPPPAPTLASGQPLVAISGDKVVEQLMQRNADLDAQIKQLQAEKTAMAGQLAEAAEQIRIRPLAPGARVGKPLFIAKTRIRFGDATIERDQPLPFDPTDPPPGCSGFEEGVHYELR